MMQATRVKQGGTVWNFSLHLQIMGYFSHPNAVCVSTTAHRGKKERKK